MMNPDQNTFSYARLASWLDTLKGFASALSPAQLIHKQSDITQFYGELGVALGKQFGDAWLQLMQHPERAIQTQIDWVDHQIDLVRNLTFESLGLVTPADADTRRQRATSRDGEDIAMSTAGNGNQPVFETEAGN